MLETKISVRDLKPSQKNAVRRIVKFYKDRNDYNSVTSVRYDLVKCSSGDYNSIWLTVNTRRSDCEKYSPRAVICNQYGNFNIGKRGGIKVSIASNGIGDRDDEKKHVSFMLNAKSI